MTSQKEGPRLLGVLRPPQDPATTGWRVVSDTQEAYWDGAKWASIVTRPGVVVGPPDWVGLVLLVSCLGLLFTGWALLGIYLLPVAGATLRRPDWWKFNATAVSLVCILTGWTIIGWVAAIVMALMRDRPPAS